MADLIDYSRPVGWWCPVCDQTMVEDKYVSCLSPGWPCNGAAIPVYLPLPTPEPVEVDEVETGEAEVVTVERDVAVSFLASIDAKWAVDRDGYTWLDAESFTYSDVASVDQINHIAAASANARKKRGMK
jgi:hypothetical protein